MLKVLEKRQKEAGIKTYSCRLIWVNTCDYRQRNRQIEEQKRMRLLNKLEEEFDEQMDQQKH